MTGLCIDRPHPRMLLSRAVCDGGLFGHESMCLSDLFHCFICFSDTSEVKLTGSKSRS